MKRIILAGFGLVVALGAAVHAARAQYVLYYHVFDEWTVICALDEPTARTRCELRAPVPDLGSATDAVRFEVIEPPAGDTAVLLRVNQAVDAARGLSLVVDGNAPHRTLLTRTGDAGWRGAEAAAILGEMAGGTTVTVRFVRWGDGAVSERRFALTGFPAARQTYLQRSSAAGAAPR